ncbi:hypothetical protein R69746_06183 [Paraburkholderia aspalathi]|uniref:hypothetical protein n=1 Tax=Paraburkholderia aspalathi TaxID=1324617 RepID=UPI00190CE614|nr:hypothetical protein [Paraburkholderia aspalathi]MBK3844356.1 hypothetical protein [Paraburkholderia aspalathi]CAE6823915.1 hypothetical protein R69746_06183 [Paraburkholderia aspalathi]
MKKSYTFEIDTDNLCGLSDDALAAYWTSAQFLPVEYGDRDACDVVRAIGVEIIQRWMHSQPVPMFHIQPVDYWRNQFSRFARWNSAEWVVDPAGGQSRVRAGERPQGA